MFDSVRGRSTTQKRPLGTGAFISAAVHVAVVGAVLWAKSDPGAEHRPEVDVTFFSPSPPPPPPPPPPAGGASRTASPETKVPVRKPDVMVEPKEPSKEPREPPKEPAPAEAGGEPQGVTGGVIGGTAGGVVGGVVGGVDGGTLGGQPGAPLGGRVGATGSQVLPFGEGMTRPEVLSGRDPTYTREALEARVEGLMIVKCVITTEGTLRNCRVIKSLPHMEKPVLDALGSRRYKPVTYQGQPVAVDYVFNIRLVLPNR